MTHLVATGFNPWLKWKRRNRARTSQTMAAIQTWRERTRWVHENDRNHPYSYFTPTNPKQDQKGPDEADKKPKECLYKLPRSGYYA
jgi:hypothetical protein